MWRLCWVPWITFLPRSLVIHGLYEILPLIFHREETRNIKAVRGGSEVGSVGFPCEGLELSSWHPYNSSESPVTKADITVWSQGASTNTHRDTHINKSNKMHILKIINSCILVREVLFSSSFRKTSSTPCPRCITKDFCSNSLCINAGAA